MLNDLLNTPKINLFYNNWTITWTLESKHLVFYLPSVSHGPSGVCMSMYDTLYWCQVVDLAGSQNPDNSAWFPTAWLTHSYFSDSIRGHEIFEHEYFLNGKVYAAKLVIILTGKHKISYNTNATFTCRMKKRRNLQPKSQRDWPYDLDTIKKTLSQTAFVPWN